MSTYCYISDCLCNILITIKVHTLVKTNRYIKIHGETIKKILHSFNSVTITFLFTCFSVTFVKTGAEYWVGQESDPITVQ